MLFLACGDVLWRLIMWAGKKNRLALVDYIFLYFCQHWKISGKQAGIFGRFGWLIGLFCASVEFCNVHSFACFQRDLNLDRFEKIFELVLSH